MTNISEAGFNKRKKPRNNYTELPKPEASFNADNKSLLENIRNHEDSLKTNNKSLVIPAESWCQFMSLLDITDNDYTYELVEELINEKVKMLDYELMQKFDRNLERRKEQEREKIEKKKRKSQKKNP